METTSSGGAERTVSTAEAVAKIEDMEWNSIATQRDTRVTANFTNTYNSESYHTSP
jgi:hypothetical protein